MTAYSKGERISGYIKLIVGYLNFDEDGGASDGIEEDIEYEFDEKIGRASCRERV